MYDRELSVVELISRGPDGPANGASNFPKISGDGRYVVFQSIASNLVDGDTNGLSDIYLFDRTDSVMVLVSVALDGTADGGSITPNISYDGRSVAYASRATNLVVTPTSGAFEQIFLADRENLSTELVSISSAARPATPSASCRPSAPTAARWRSSQKRSIWSPTTPTASPTCSCAIARRKPPSA